MNQTQPKPIPLDVYKNSDLLELWIDDQCKNMNVIEIIITERKELIIRYENMFFFRGKARRKLKTSIKAAEYQKTKFGLTEAEEIKLQELKNALTKTV